MRKKYNLLLGSIGITMPFTAIACFNHAKDKTFENNVKLDNLVNLLKNEDAKKFLRFKDPEASFSKIEFDDFTSNNFINHHFYFDFNKIKDILQKTLNVPEEEIKKYDYEIDYHNIRQNDANINQLIFPVKFKYFFDENIYGKGIYQKKYFDFLIDNIKLSEKENDKYLEINKLFNDLKNNVNPSDINITFNNNYDNSIVNYNIDELNTNQINSLFNLQIPTKVEMLKSANPNFVFKSFVEKINLGNLDDKITLNIRFSIGKPKSLKDLNESDVNLGFSITTIPLNIDSSNAIYHYIKNQKIKNNVKISMKSFNKFNYDFNNLNLNNFQFESLDPNYMIKIINYENIDLRNVLFNFKLINKETLKETTFSKKYGVGNYTNIYKKSFEEHNYKAYDFNVDYVTQEQLTRVNTSIFNAFGNKMYSGGYDSNRAIYTSEYTTPVSLHVGEDYLAPSLTPIVAPYNGEIVAAYSWKPDQKNIASDVGTTILMKVPVKELNLTPKEKEIYLQDNLNGYIYIGFIHLDQNQTLNNNELGWSSSIYKSYTYANPTPKNPTIVQKGQIIGYIGDTNTNGGWMPHVHTTVYNNAEKYYNRNGFYTKIRDRKRRVNSYDPIKKHNFASARVDGVILAPGFPNFKKDIYVVDSITGKPIVDSHTSEKIVSVGEKAIFAINPITNQEKKVGFFDPNVLFKIRGEESFSFDIKTFFNL